MDLNNIELQSQLKKLSKMEKELTDELENEIKAEEEIEKQSESIAEMLIKKPKLRTIIDGKQFCITFKIQPILIKQRHVTTGEIKENPIDHIVLIIADVNKYALAGGKYMPFVTKAKIDKNYSLKDNLKASIKAFIGHITGRIEVGELED